MSDRLPRVVLFFIYLPTNFVQGSLDVAITNLVVKILTNCHYMFENPLLWPICVLRKCIPEVFVVKKCILRQDYPVQKYKDFWQKYKDFSHTLGGLRKIQRLCIFVRSTLINGPVRCDGCGTLLFTTDCVRKCRGSVFLYDTTTVPRDFCLPGLGWLKIYFFHRLSVSLVHGVRVVCGGWWEWEIFLFLFCQLFGPVNRPQNWKSWEWSGEKLDYNR